MSHIERRLLKLEQDSGISRLIIASQPRDMTDAQLEGFLQAQGISTTTADLQISLKRLAEGDPNPWVSIDGQRLPQKPF